MIKRYLAFAKANPVVAVIMGICLGSFFVFGSTKPPPTIEKGISLTECLVDSQGISIKWDSKDDRITPGESVFIIEARERDTRIGPYLINKGYNPSWYEIGRTKDFNYIKRGVWTDKTREIRVRTVLEQK